MLSGYRGFLRELSRTGGWSALSLQLRTGARHGLRRLLRAGGGDPIARFLAHYGADGFRLPDAERARLALAAEACLACGLCSAECARVDGAPPFDPRDAVVAGARLEIDWIRLAPASTDPLASPCAGCRACEAVCPTRIPIARLEEVLARLVGGARSGAPSAVATPAAIR